MNISSILKKYPEGDRSSLISVLQEVQDKFGYLPKEILPQVSDYLEVSLSRIHGVITFYSQFYLVPYGKYRIKLCQGTACHVKGVSRIRDTIKEELGINPSETTKDKKFSLDVVFCLGTCSLAPVMMINNQYYGKLNSKKVKSILKSF